jgi:hypothetical protein
MLIDRFTHAMIRLLVPGIYLLCESKFSLYNKMYSIVCRQSQCAQPGNRRDHRQIRSVLSLFCFVQLTMEGNKQ